MWFNPGFVQGLDKRPGTPDPGPEPGPPSRPELPRQGGEYPSITMLDEMEAGNLQALFVLGGNVLSALPDAQRVQAALERTPVVVVSDVQHGDMTEDATHVLAAAGPLERADLPHFSDCLAPTLAAQYTPAGRSGRRRPEARPGGRSPRSPSASGRRSCPEGLALESATDDDLLRLRMRPSARATFDELKAAPTRARRRGSIARLGRAQHPPGRALEPGAGAARSPSSRTWRKRPPLVLIPRRLWRRVNSYGRDLPSVLEREPANILVHPDRRGSGGRRRRRPSLRRERVRPPRAGSQGRRVDPPRRRRDPARLADPNVSTLLSATENVDLLTGMPTYSGVPDHPQRASDPLPQPRARASAPR